MEEYDIFRCGNGTGIFFLAKNPSNDKSLTIPRIKTIDNGIKSLIFQRPKFRSALPDDIKTAQNSRQFKDLVKTWFLENKYACSSVADYLFNAIFLVANLN